MVPSEKNMSKRHQKNIQTGSFPQDKKQENMFETTGPVDRTVLVPWLLGNVNVWNHHQKWSFMIFLGQGFFCLPTNKKLPKSRHPSTSTSRGFIPGYWGVYQERWGRLHGQTASFREGFYIHHDEDLGFYQRCFYGMIFFACDNVLSEFGFRVGQPRVTNSSNMFITSLSPGTRMFETLAVRQWCLNFRLSNTP